MSIATEIERIKTAKENIINTLKANDIQIEETASIDEVDVIMNDVPILDTSDATATAGDIAKDKTAYVNGEKITGTLESSQGNYNATLDIEDRTTFTFANLLKEIDFTNIDTSKITSFSDSFVGCKYMEKINGVIDCTNATTMVRMFSNCSILNNVSLSNTSNVTNMSAMFNNCSNLTTLNLTNFDTSKVTSFQKMFYGCQSLVTLPLLNGNGITTVTGINNMFHNCISLSDESLNNILAFCLTLNVKVTLNYIGLTSEQATRCQSLSNYQAFLDAGWLTGF